MVDILSKDILPAFRRYYPTLTPLDHDWPLHVLSAGSNTVSPGTPEITLDADWSSLPGGWYQQQAGHGRKLRDFELVYIVAGRGRFWDEQLRCQDVAAGDVFLLAPGQWHHYTFLRETGWSEYWAVFNGPQAARLRGSGLFTPDRPVLRVLDDPELREMFENILTACHHHRPGFQMEAASWLLLIISRLFQADTVLKRTVNPTEEAIRSAIEWIEEAKQEELTMEEVAADLHVSYAHFRRCFKQTTGMSPHQYHLQVRLNHAKGLLTQTAMLIHEVAQACGFPDEHYFSRLFRKKTGCSPRVWREQAHLAPLPQKSGNS